MSLKITGLQFDGGVVKLDIVGDECTLIAEGFESMARENAAIDAARDYVTFCRVAKTVHYTKYQ